MIKILFICWGNIWGIYRLHVNEAGKPCKIKVFPIASTILTPVLHLNYTSHEARHDTNRENERTCTSSGQIRAWYRCFFALRRLIQLLRFTDCWTAPDCNVLRLFLSRQSNTGKPTRCVQTAPKRCCQRARTCRQANRKR